ncbi:MAG TPA: diguanylate cyclase [Solirubrobacteraceae bacterium]|nr:diguanylate cyclase [Solirubrobacteraceae bacterium]
MSDIPAEADLLDGQLAIADLEREFFDRAHDEHLSAQTLEMVLASLVAAYPAAPVSALTPEGVMVAMPPLVPLRENPVLEARAGVDLLMLDEQVIAAWDRALAQGAARCTFHPAGHPDVDGTLYTLDLRERHGLIVTLAVVDASELAQPTVGAQDVPEAAPRCATMLKDSGAFIVKVDEALTKILWWSADEMEGRRSLEFIHPDDQALAVDNWMQMLAVPGPGRRVRLRHRRKDDAWVWFEVTNHNQLGDPEDPCVICQMVDITDEMAAHEELRAREQLLDRLAEAAPVGLLQFDARRDVLYTNDRLHQILGVERAGTVEAQLRSVAEPSRGILDAALEGVLGDGAHAEIEVELRLPGTDELRFCTMGLCALSDDGGAVSGAIACVADVTDSARLREELKRQATFDALTGCYNRASLMCALETSIAAGSPEADRAVVFVDVDRFKDVNDRYGHVVGDELLRVVAQRLQHAARDGDQVGRIGGDEFLVLCPQVGGPDDAVRLATRLADAQREQVHLAGRVITPQISVGVAWSRGESTTAEALVGQADHAMYESKRERLGRPKLASDRSAGATAGGSGAIGVSAGSARAATSARAAGRDLRAGVGASCEAPASLIDQASGVARQALGMDMTLVAALRASTISALLSALHARDFYTTDHSHAVVSLALAVGRELSLDSQQLLDLESVALLHDIGKIGICDAVLRKPEQLSDAEWTEMRRHPDIGADIVAGMPSIAYLAPAVRAEHERWDGRGYPNRLEGERIPLLSRIVFVCDAYHAMTSDRPYRRALGHEAALREINDNAGSQFCPRSALALARVLERTQPARAAQPRRRLLAKARPRSRSSRSLSG